VAGSPKLRWLLLGAIVAAGLATRRYGSVLPEVVAVYGGDTVWALMVFVGLGLVFPNRPLRWMAIVAFAISFGVELSQLYHTAWLDELRRSRLGALILGQGFLWSDLVCYAIGIGLGVTLELLWVKCTSIRTAT
jgi:hypothetical protein